MMKSLLAPVLLLITLSFSGSLLSAKVATKTPAKNAGANAVTPAQLLQKGKDAYMNYDFEEAEDFFSRYSANPAANRQEAEEWQQRLTIASNAFDRIQQIVVLDSINIPRASFFKAFRLPASAGKIGRPSDFKVNVAQDMEEVSFLSEDGDYLITSIENEDGDLNLTEFRKLLDGSWEELDALEGDFEKDGDYAFPFLGADGQTLYFGNNGDGSMGGYDLFVVQKEPITGECLQPLNLGMPFNSPYDDLMIAIDEENGIGWWATDRNSPGGDITVYVYILDDVRKNYPSDTPDLENYARISNYKSTWQEGREGDYKALLNKLK